jgi:Uma2 family endonuclease
MSAHAVLPDPLAPWAEVVPTPGPVTVDLLLTLPDDGFVYEVVEGVLVRVAGSGNRAARLAARLTARLVDHVEAHGLGVVTGADGVYKMPGAETGLIPDLGFYTTAHLPLILDEDKPIPFAPDLAVEVASPSQSAADMAAKARTYLRGGTSLVWVIWPRDARVDVWRRPARTGPALSLGLDEVLEGEDVLPGFSYPLARLFAGPLG